MGQTLTERIENIVPKLTNDGAFNNYNVKRVDGSEGTHYLLKMYLTPDQIPDTEEMQLVRMGSSYRRSDFRGWKNLFSPLKELLGTSIAKDASHLEYHIKNEMLVRLTEYSTLIFIDPEFDFSEYESLMKGKDVRVKESKLGGGSKVSQSSPSAYEFGKAFPKKLMEEGIVYSPGGTYPYRNKSIIQNVPVSDLFPLGIRMRTDAKDTRNEANLRTFEILGKTDEPWYELPVRESFARILEKDIMRDDIVVDFVWIKGKKSHSRTDNLPNSDITDVIKMRKFLEKFTMRRNVVVDGRGVTVDYKKDFERGDDFKGKRSSYRYMLNVQGTRRNDIETALLQLNNYTNVDD